MKTSNSLHTLRVLEAGGREYTHHDVLCPMEDRLVDYDVCKDCARARALPVRPEIKDAAVDCDVPGTKPPRRPVCDVAIEAAKLPVHEAMGPATAVELTVQVDAATRVMIEHGLHALVVVDRDSRPVGLVSHVDLVSERWMNEKSARGAPAQARTVAELMTPIVHTLPEGARLSHAFALMALEGIHQVPIVREDGRLSGLLTAVEAIRWLARNMGYVL